MKFKKSEPAVPEVDMTPMIDIVFQLIAFFMVITNFEQQQRDDRVKLPSNQLARPPEVKRDKEFVLNVGFERKDGERVGLGEPLVFYSGLKLTIPQIKPKLKNESLNFKQTNVNPSDVSVIIRADAEVPFGDVQALIKAAQEQDFSKFALKAKQKSST